MTVLDLLTESSIMIGTLAPGEDLSAAEQAYGLSKLNQMIDMWAADRLAIYRRQRVGPFTIVAGTQTYSIGPTGAWVTARPVWIDNAGIIYNPSATQPAEVGMRILTQDEYARVGTKNVQSSLPRELYYDHDFGASGLGAIVLIQKPTTSTPQIVLYVPVAATEFADLVTVISLPPGYRMALVSNLAVLMGLGIKSPQADVMALAATSFGNLKASNLVTHMDAMTCDPGLTAGPSGTFDWLTGGFQ